MECLTGRNVPRRHDGYKLQFVDASGIAMEINKKLNHAPCHVKCYIMNNDIGYTKCRFASSISVESSVKLILVC